MHSTGRRWDGGEKRARRNRSPRSADYELRSVIGRGTQGTVYEARQMNPARSVAIKVLNAGAPFSGARERFEDEAAILARLQHPGIAAVYAVGTAQGPGGTRRPFIAMELVHGRPLLERAEKSWS